MSSIFPGSKRHFFTIFSCGKVSTPISDAIITKSSSVTKYRAGRKPLRSNVAPIIRPSVNATAAGPSHGSINAA